MGVAQAIREGFSKSFDYSGRANRLEFWTFALFCLIVQRYFSKAEFFLWNSGWISEADLSFPTLAKLHWLSFLSNSVQTFLTIPLGYFPENGVMRGNWMGNWTFLSAPNGKIGLPVFLVLAVPTMSIALRRARDAGWSPGVALLAWTWPQLLLLVSNGFVSMAALIGGGVQSFAIIWTDKLIGPFFIHIVPFASELTALFAVFVFASASVANPGFCASEALK